MKRQRLTSKQDDFEVYSADEDNVAGENDDEFEVDIDFCDVKEQDFHGIKALLNGFVSTRKDFPLSDLADAIVNQVSVGTVIKSGDEAPVGIISMLNINQHKDRLFWKDHISKQIPLQDIIDTFGQASDLGLLINERLINCPPEVGPVAVQNLLEDVDWALKNEETNELKELFKIKGVIYPTFIAANPLQAQQNQSQGNSSKHKDKQKKGKAKKQMGVDNAQDVVFLKPEDEWLFGVSDGNVTIAGGEDGISLFIMWFQFDKLQEAPNATSSLLEN
eukprot:TRINITY_DN2092_c0_g1_i1.p2 TRINITY_DN2092_c0_g1~~TRINITY_DN2092_c0_g1_i1.p2  ORF type:complete len:276 (+),score=42.13 TRINITY_DN2092_c0_g1_i1:165-992(+)